MANDATAGGLTPDTIEYLKTQIDPETGKKYTQAGIARLFGVSRQRVSQVKLEGGDYSRTPRELATSVFPWPDIPREHNMNHLCRMLHNHAEFMVSLGRDMDWRKRYDLRNFYRMLRRENAVVEYDPRIGPTEDNPYGGFVTRPRKPEDDELIIRVNKWAKMYPESRDIWSWPPRDPEV